MTSLKVIRISALVMALAFVMHSLNGFFIERTFLGLTSFNDYSVISKLQDAIGSVPWKLSGIGHFSTAFAVLVLSISLSELAKADGYGGARLIGRLGIVSAVGFAANGVANGIGAQVVKLLQENNSDVVGIQAATIASFSIFEAIMNAVAIVMFGAFLITVTIWGRRFGYFSKSLVICGWIAGMSGILMAFVYLPAYLMFYLIWLIWFLIVVKSSGMVKAPLA